MKRLTILLTFLASVLPASSNAALLNPTPKRAARETQNCLIARGWNANLSDQGFTVDAKAPRKLDRYPYHPWYSVAFYGGQGTRTSFNEIRMKLNRRENRTATWCRQAAWRS